MNGRLIILSLALTSTPLHAQRITLASHAPVMTTNQTSKSTVFVDCWKSHAGVSYWNGSADAVMALSGCEASLALQASGTGVLNANDVFDVMATASGRCIPTNGGGAGWAGDGGSLGARGSGYTAIDETLHAYPTNANAVAHCYNGSTDYGPIAANQASLVGSVCTDPAAAGKVSYILGYAATGGGPARLCVWNVFDEPLRTEVADNGPNWTFLGYTSGSTIIDIENLDTAAGGPGTKSCSSPDCRATRQRSAS